MAEPDKLDQVLEHLNGIHTMCDSFKTRLDTIEEEHKKDREEWKARADAEAKEKADAKARADKERADATSEAKVRATHAARIAEIERKMELEKPKFADAQMRADSAYQALALGQAPPSLYGESLPDYRVRLLNGLKQHSKLYSGSNLASLAVADEAAFAGVESSIINDAVEASCAPPPVGHALREREVRTDTGHIRREFFGDPAVTWGPFMGGATRIGRIKRPKIEE